MLLLGLRHVRPALQVDMAFQGTDREAVEMAAHLLRCDGLFLGSSAAMNCVGAVKACPSPAIWSVRAHSSHTVWLICVSSQLMSLESSSCCTALHLSLELPATLVCYEHEG